MNPKKNYGSYGAASKLDNNSWITAPEVPDPENIPEPLGWTLLVRPYAVDMNRQKTSIILPEDDMNMMSYLTNIGRVVSIGPCCWNKPEHLDKNGNRFDWVKVGDFVSYPKNVGAKRIFKGVSYVLLVDDEIVEKLPDPQVFDEDYYKLNIPQEDLEKYNTIYNKKDKK